MTPRAALLLAPLALVVGCASEPLAPTKVAKDREGWVASWDKLMEDPALAGGGHLDLPGMTHPVYVGEFLAVHLISLRPEDRLDPPLDPAHEALIVVEGEGTVDLGGERGVTTFEDGSVGLFPKGTRGRIRVGKKRPLLALLLRRVPPARTAADDETASKGGQARPVGEPRLLGPDEVLPEKVLFSPKPLEATTLGSIPGGMTVNLVSVRGRVRRHVHLRHDEFVFVLVGSGDFGMGVEGGSGERGDGDEAQREKAKASGKVVLPMGTRSWQPHKIRERTLCFIPFRSPHEYQNRAKRTIALSVFGPDARSPMQDRYFVPDKAKPVAKKKTVSRTVPPAGELPPPKKR